MAKNEKSIEIDCNTFTSLCERVATLETFRIEHEKYLERNSTFWKWAVGIFVALVALCQKF